METNIVSVKYADVFDPKTFNGKAYNYYTNKKLEVGDLVIAPVQEGEKIARVSEINIPEIKVEMIKPFLKTITIKIDKNLYLENNKIVNEMDKITDGEDVANILINKLINKDFIVHRHNSHGTTSIYLKLDYGVSCGIRIADHPGRKKYHYRFNVIKDYKGEKVIRYEYQNLFSYFFDYNELDEVVDAVCEEKKYKIKDYGYENYKKYMEKNSQDDLYSRFDEMKGVA